MGYIVLIGMLSAIVGAVVSVLNHKSITKFGGRIMASLVSLQAKIDELAAAQAEREARDIVQDEVTAGQIATLQTTVDELRAIIEGGALSPENQVIIDSSIAKVQATIDSLNAADPTAPIIP